MLNKQPKNTRTIEAVKRTRCQVPMRPGYIERNKSRDEKIARRTSRTECRQYEGRSG